MNIKRMPVGYLMTNCYLVWDEESGEAMIIDPGAEAGKLLRAIENTGCKLKYVLLTHGHYDHTGAADEISRKTGAPVYIHPADVNTDPADRGAQLFYTPAPDTQIKTLAEGDELSLGGHVIKVLNTTGHSKGSCVFLMGGEMFSGDTLFAGSCGRTDFTGGDSHEMMMSLKRLHDLPGNFNVYPGHEGTSTLENERRSNYFMMGF